MDSNQGGEGTPRHIPVRNDWKKWAVSFDKKWLQTLENMSQKDRVGPDGPNSPKVGGCVGRVWWIRQEGSRRAEHSLLMKLLSASDLSSP